MTKEEIKHAKSLIGKMSREDIAKEIGTSVADLKRSCRGVRFWFQNGKYINNPTLVRAVLKHYEKHGKVPTQKAFPDIILRSIVERAESYGASFKPRQKRWDKDSLRMAAQMAGLLPMDIQAKLLNRPRANVGSIKSLFAKKRLPCEPRHLNGIEEFYAKHIVSGDCPRFKVRVGGAKPTRSIVLWCDAEKFLKPSIPTFVKDGIESMARFQKWLWGTENPKRKIVKLIQLDKYAFEVRKDATGSPGSSKARSKR